MWTLFLKTVLEKFDFDTLRVPVGRPHVIINGPYNRGDYLTEAEDTI